MLYFSIAVLVLSIIVLVAIMVRPTAKRLEFHDQLGEGRPYFDNWFTINYIQILKSFVDFYQITAKKVLRKLVLLVARGIHWIAVGIVIGANNLAERMDQEIDQYSEEQAGNSNRKNNIQYSHTPSKKTSHS